MASRAEDLNFRNDLAVALDSEELADQVLERMPMVPAHNLATKDDLAELRGELLERFGELRGEFGELRGEFHELRADIADRMRMQTWVVAGLVVSAMGAMGAIAAVI